jgi:hypothetical protein
MGKQETGKPKRAAVAPALTSLRPCVNPDYKFHFHAPMVAGVVGQVLKPKYFHQT